MLALSEAIFAAWEKFAATPDDQAAASAQAPALLPEGNPQPRNNPLGVRKVEPPPFWFKLVGDGRGLQTSGGRRAHYLGPRVMDMGCF